MKSLMNVEIIFYFLQIRQVLASRLCSSWIIIAFRNMRNLMKSLIEFLNIYTVHCNVMINNWKFNIMTQNAIFLLIILYFDSETAMLIMFHIWYSALISASVLHSFQVNILSLIKNVCAKIQFKSSSVLQAKTWIYDKTSLHLVFMKEQWICFQQFFKISDDFSVVLAQKIWKLMILIRLILNRKNYHNCALYRQLSAWHMCTMKFHKNEIFLLFELSQEKFDTSNL